MPLVLCFCGKRERGPLTGKAESYQVVLDAGPWMTLSLTGFDSLVDPRLPVEAAENGDRRRCRLANRLAR
jgi:hypothetical protein